MSKRNVTETNDDDLCRRSLYTCFVSHQKIYSWSNFGRHQTLIEALLTNVAHVLLVYALKYTQIHIHLAEWKWNEWLSINCHTPTRSWTLAYVSWMQFIQHRDRRGGCEYHVLNIAHTESPCWQSNSWKWFHICAWHASNEFWERERAAAAERIWKIEKPHNARCALQFFNFSERNESKNRNRVCRCMSGTRIVQNIAPGTRYGFCARALPIHPTDMETARRSHSCVFALKSVVCRIIVAPLLN